MVMEKANRTIRSNKQQLSWGALWEDRALLTRLSLSNKSEVSLAISYVGRGTLWILHIEMRAFFLFGMASWIFLSPYYQCTSSKESWHNPDVSYTYSGALVYIHEPGHNDRHGTSRALVPLVRCIALDLYPSLNPKNYMHQPEGILLTETWQHCGNVAEETANVEVACKRIVPSPPSIFAR